jgi:hypothetical protein
MKPRLTIGVSLGAGAVMGAMVLTAGTRYIRFNS